ncbi:MAG: AAA family ATPase [Erysipelotrichaceae bacterium]|nr:AAA family ATPase [Erysipelotrichaceae bacterium]
MGEDLIKLHGYFKNSFFRSETYMVSKFISDDGPITTTGPSFDYEENKRYTLTGSYVDHPRYGFQFSYLKVERCMPNHKEEIISFLKSDLFNGIGKKTALKIYDQLGDDALTILKENPERIYDLSLSKSQAEALAAGFEKLYDPENEIIFKLVSGGFSNLEARRIFSVFKLGTIEVGEENPFRYYTEVSGVSFPKVVEYARNIEFPDSMAKFQEAYLIYILTDYMFNTGDLFITRDNLKSHISKLKMKIDLDDIIPQAIDHGYLIEEEDRYYLSVDYDDENYIASFLNLFSNKLSLEDDIVAGMISDDEQENSICYDLLQKEAISAFFQEDISLVIGGPGTGKTTIVKSMAAVFKKAFPFANLIVVAPTGRAAKRISEICDVEAKTIHSLLKWNKESNTFGFDIDNPLLYDAIIIDEFSMVDSNLFACLLKACGNIKKLCLIGDDNQLPSIRPGNVLNDLIESKLFKTTRLNTNHRQSEGSGVIELANDIINDSVDTNKDYRDVSIIDPGIGGYPDLLSMINQDLDEGYFLDDIQLLSPMYKGEHGIDKLNQLMQEAFNPFDENKKQHAFGQQIFRVDDKVLQLKNRPSDDIYNGDIGIIEDIDYAEKTLIINFQNNIVYYKYENLDELAIAYAMSVHKSQGSEYPIVYFSLTENNLRMLNRNLIYTAVTRAKRKLVIIAKPALLQNGIKREIKKRNSTLVKRLTGF